MNRLYPDALGKSDPQNIRRQDKVAGVGSQGGAIEGGAPFDPIGAAHKLLDEAAAHRSLQADQILMLKMVMPSFSAQVSQLSQGLFQWFRHQGFWPQNWEMGGPFNAASSENGNQRFHDAEYVSMKKAEKLALITTEISECVEAVRKGDVFNEAEELADALVRIFDYAGGFEINLADAFERKMYLNYQRPFRHNKKF